MEGHDNRVSRTVSGLICKPKAVNDHLLCVIFLFFFKKKSKFIIISRLEDMLCLTDSILFSYPQIVLLYRIYFQWASFWWLYHLLYTIEIQKC